MKMLERIIFPIALSLIIAGCNASNNSLESINEKSKIEDVAEGQIINEQISNKDLDINSIKKSGEDNGLNMIKIEVNGKDLEVELEDNQATKELVQKLSLDNVTINASEYGGFEKVGSLGFSLPRDDKQIRTEAGDIVLYQGNQISLFYNSNSWSYTKIGKVTNMSAKELKELLGTSDVILILKKN